MVEQEMFHLGFRITKNLNQQLSTDMKRQCDLASRTASDGTNFLSIPGNTLDANFGSRHRRIGFEQCD